MTDSAPALDRNDGEEGGGGWWRADSGMGEDKRFLSFLKMKTDYNSLLFQPKMTSIALAKHCVKLS